jgi:hypothetical protein
MALTRHVSLVVYVICLLPLVCNGECLPATKTVQEEFEVATHVARLTYVNIPVTLPGCGMEMMVYGSLDGYEIRDMLPLYKMEESFKGSLEGDIPIVWGTGTGLSQQEIPSRYNETGGFLAPFLIPYRNCRITAHFEYSADSQLTPYEMNECVFVNQPALVVRVRG